MSYLKKGNFIYFSLIFISTFFILSMQLQGLEKETENRIKKLVASNSKQLSVKEYSLIAEIILKKAPCNVLVFGVGRDSQLWIDCNRDGKTIFLEDNETWLNLVRSQIPGLVAYQVDYHTKRSQWANLLKKPSKLYMNLPANVLLTKWDVIFVDAPAGYSDKKPGRMKSIYMASFLAKNQPLVHVFVHDCNRPVEQKYCDKFLKQANLVQSVDRLRHYILK